MTDKRSGEVRNALRQAQHQLTITHHSSSNPSASHGLFPHSLGDRGRKQTHSSGHWLRRLRDPCIWKLHVGKEIRAQNSHTPGKMHWHHAGGYTGVKSTITKFCQKATPFSTFMLALMWEVWSAYSFSEAAPRVRQTYPCPLHRSRREGGVKKEEGKEESCLALASRWSSRTAP